MRRIAGVLAGTVLLASLPVGAPAEADDAVPLSLGLTTTALDPGLPGTDVSFTATVSPAQDGSVVLRDGDTVVGDPVNVSQAQPRARLAVPAPASGAHHWSATFTPLDSSQPGATSPTLNRFVADPGLGIAAGAPLTRPLAVTAPAACPDGAATTSLVVDGTTAPVGASLDDLDATVGRHDVTFACSAADGSVAQAWTTHVFVTDDTAHRGWFESTDDHPTVPTVALTAAVGKSAAVLTATVTPRGLGGSIEVRDGDSLLVSKPGTRLVLRRASLLHGSHQLTARFVPTDRSSVVSTTSPTVGLGRRDLLTFAPRGHVGDPIAISSGKGCGSATVSSTAAGWTDVPLADGGLVATGTAAGKALVTGRYDLVEQCGKRTSKGTLWVTDANPTAGWWESAHADPTATTATVTTKGSQLQVRVSPATAGHLAVLVDGHLVSSAVVTAKAAKGAIKVAAPTGGAVTVRWLPKDVSSFIVAETPLTPAVDPATLPTGLDVAPVDPTTLKAAVVPAPQIAPPPSQDIAAGGPDALTISTPYTTDTPLDLGSLQLNSRGDAYIGGGTFDGISVSDGRSDKTPWTLLISSSDLVADDDVIPASSVTFSDVQIEGCTKHCTAQARPDAPEVDVKGVGDGRLKGTFQIVAPTSTSAGTYSGTLTFTII